MTTKPENPNAFPMPGLSGLPNGQFMHGDHGMTLRDYFAAAALQAIIEKHIAASMDVNHYGANHPDRKLAAEGAYAYADAMLVARAA